jgi:PIN domain nuclease of toxin-antitoxin system
MKILLDTHAYLWYIAGDTQLSAAARNAIESETNDIFISSVSLWEITIKNSIGKLPLATPVTNIVDRYVKENGFNSLNICASDLLCLHELPWHHRDPFDRMLIAQAQSNKLTLISKDSKMGQYEITVIW